MRRAKPMLVTGFQEGNPEDMFVDFVMGYNAKSAEEAVKNRRGDVTIINVTERKQVLETLLVLEAIENGTAPNIIHLET